MDFKSESSFASMEGKWEAESIYTIRHLNGEGYLYLATNSNPGWKANHNTTWVGLFFSFDKGKKFVVQINCVLK